MRWTERQHALLEAIGVRLWEPGEAPVAGLPAQAESPPAVMPVAAPAAPVAPSIATPVLPPAAATTPALELSSRDAAIAAMSWPQLRESVAGCEACSLCKTRRQTVFGVGHEQAQWMIVGEAPGEQEDAQGEPFVGQAGKLLDNMLAAIGLTRAQVNGAGPGSLIPAGDGRLRPGLGHAQAQPEQQVFIANTLKCRPPRNRNPQPDELAACRPYLLRQVALVQPRIIVAMGRFAVNAMLGSDEAIGRLRGRVHRFGSVPMIVTYHPAYLLRQLGDKAKAWEDLCLAASVVAQAEDEARSTR
jgi:uracil-DNA glycosylase